MSSLIFENLIRELKNFFDSEAIQIDVFKLEQRILFLAGITSKSEACPVWLAKVDCLRKALLCLALCSNAKAANS